MSVQLQPPVYSPAENRALFTPWQIGSLALPNRMVMAPMTRSRASADGVPSPLAATYYAQRAGAGLIVTEATHASPGGGQYRTPGIHSPRQIAAWRQVTNAVHAAGGRIFLQIWHTGRAAHPDLRDGKLPVAPSPISAGGDARVAENLRKPRVVPHPLTVAEIRTIIEDFRTGAKNAIAAGFDGIELHGANGYLLDQFTRDGTNQRTDDYGGSIERRARFGLEVAAVAAEAIGAERVGYRVSPLHAFNAMSDSDPVATFSYLAGRLSDIGIGYLHVIDPADAATRVTPVLRGIFRGTYVVSTGFDGTTGAAAVAAGEADLVAFGVPFLANPDLPRRYRDGAPLNEPHHATFYTSGAEGYVDYPALT